MTTSKTALAPVTFVGIPVVVHSQQVERTRELPAIDHATLEGEEDETNAQAAPREILDGDVTVPVRCSIESTLTFEVLRRQSIESDDGEGPS